MTKPHAHHHAAESSLSTYLDLRGIITGVIVFAICAVLAWLARWIWSGRPQLGCFGKIDKSGYVRVDIVAPKSMTATIAKVEVVARRPILYRFVQALFRVTVRGDNAVVATVHNGSFSVTPGAADRAFGVALNGECILPSRWNPLAMPSTRKWRRRELRLKTFSNQPRRFVRGEARFCRYSRLSEVHGTLVRVP